MEKYSNTSQEQMGLGKSSGPNMYYSQGGDPIRERGENYSNPRPVGETGLESDEVSSE